ncbi:MAG TPA: LysM peptidoglycan-binding domain-containing protein [Candidatus Polarisedimenticolaceae bacterium]|nr:LysM peptidoglycan-binding domain-containing protein [Candidatus Polarisedimenticolaceae bacterium]
MPPRAQVPPARPFLLVMVVVLMAVLGACASAHQEPATKAKGPSWTSPTKSTSAAAKDKAATPSDPDFAWDPAEEGEAGTAQAGDADDAQDADDPDQAAEEGEAPADDSTVQAEEVEPDESAEPTQAPVQDLAVQDPELSPDEIRKERSVAEEPEITYDIPMVYNDKVLAWVDFYSNRHRDRFVPGLERSGRYLPMIRRIFEEEGIPLDLAYLAHVESAFKPNALSRAHAKGMFQFMARTGREYGLRQDYWIDERSDPEKCTRAAARYLKDLYAMFGDWHLAMAAYNGGPGRVSRAMAQTRATDFWSLALTSRIRKETKNYVPAILAVTLISKNPQKYGFTFVPEPPLEYDTIDVDGAVDLRVLARLAGSDGDTLHSLNPALRRHQTPPDRVTAIRVPKGTGVSTLAALMELPASERVIVVYHHVRRGDTLSRIASRYGVSVASLQRENKMGKKTVLHAGQTLRVPTGGVGAPGTWSEEPVASSRSKPRTTGGTILYRVRRGDTLTHVASRYGTTTTAIAAANGFSARRELRAGERIRVVPGARSAEVARRASKRPSGGKPAPTVKASVHTVRSGDTLWKIATKYRVSVGELCELNDLSVGSPLIPGMRLTVSR